MLKNDEKNIDKNGDLKERISNKKTDKINCSLIIKLPPECSNETRELYDNFAKKIRRDYNMKMEVRI